MLVLINVVLSEEQPAPKVNEHMKLFHMRQLLSRQASQYLAEIIQTKIKSDGKSQKVTELDSSDKSSSNGLVIFYWVIIIILQNFTLFLLMMAPDDGR